MRAEPNHRAEQLVRLNGPAGTNNGHFQDGPRTIIASSGGGWEHVSVSRRDRVPNWDEMCRVKQKFWRDDEVVMQLHVDDSRKVNQHRYALHLWRPQSNIEIAEERKRWEANNERWPWDGLESSGEIPLPPRGYV